MQPDQRSGDREWEASLDRMVGKLAQERRKQESLRVEAEQREERKSRTGLVLVLLLLAGAVVGAQLWYLSQPAPTQSPSAAIDMDKLATANSIAEMLAVDALIQDHIRKTGSPPKSLASLARSAPPYLQERIRRGRILIRTSGDSYTVINDKLNAPSFVLNSGGSLQRKDADE